jgi:DNA-binding MarR family transcriptional regulator
MSRSGADLALLLLGGFRALVDDAMVELAHRGYEDVRPTHDFAMRAIAAGADNASELARRLSVSKQAAAKTVAVLQDRGYVAREADHLDARRKRLHVTALGFEVMQEGEAIFDELRAKWKQQIGSDELERLESRLAVLVGASRIRVDTPGWIADDLGQPISTSPPRT